MKFFIDANYKGQKLFNYLKNQSIPFNLINKLVRKNKILINGNPVEENIQLSINDTVEIQSKIEINKKPDSNKDIKELASQFKNLIVFENNDLIAINKPDNIPVQLGSKITFCVETLMNAYCLYIATLINEKTNNNLSPKKLRLVHRIDKNTSGLLLIAKTIDAARKLTKGFEEHSIHKTYLAILNFEDKESYYTIKPFGIIENKLKKQNISGEELMVESENGDLAITEYEVIKKLNHRYILVKFSPKTGRTHQLRAHSKNLGGYILGDKKYTFKKDNEKHLYLHSSKIIVDKKIFGKEIEIQAPLPIYFENKL